ncbi:hypothetical protein [Kitasatospora sp. MAP5-34]|uniref:hypothetical protein n=1 Tax=Kitasatospora sp. MAP5-34 TaxID=3035102 RepID=UPI002474DB28|nr:hypothetical protein [Kitasatospora sp. MAP5-34]MDH6574923.1 hypothetical protein [Kitasatospora sp. MAP5-34]
MLRGAPNRPALDVAQHGPSRPRRLGVVAALAVLPLAVVVLPGTAAPLPPPLGACSGPACPGPYPPPNNGD